MFRSLVVVLCLASVPVCLAPLAACSSDDDGGVDPVFSCADDGRAPEFLANYAQDGTTVHVVLNSTPAPPLKGDSTWTIMVTDANDAPLTGLTIDSTPFMPDHGHGTPLQETVTESATAGEYVLEPINLWMPGYWEVTIDFDDGEGMTDSVMYKVCIDG